MARHYKASFRKGRASELCRNALLGMGFTGNKALKFKRRYIAAFKE